MNAIDLILIAVLALLIAFIVRQRIQRRKRGGCSCGCAGCDKACSPAGRKNSRDLKEE